MIERLKKDWLSYLFALAPLALAVWYTHDHRWGYAGVWLVFAIIYLYSAISAPRRRQEALAKQVGLIQDVIADHEEQKAAGL